MPEGHTIHALAARLTRAFEGRPVRATSPQGRFAAGAERLDGLALLSALAVGKHLFVSFGVLDASGTFSRPAAPGEDREGGDAHGAEVLLHVHLGLIGQFPVKPFEQGGPVDPVGAVRLRLVGERHVADLRGPMICSVITPERMDLVISTLGPDPLDPAADDERAWRSIGASRSPIAQLLMNQSVVAGVGNVYRCEVLHRHRVDPFTPGRELSASTWQRLWGDLVDLLPLGVAFSQILTMEDQVAEAQALRVSGAAAEHERVLTGERLGDRFERRFHVYKRTGEACLRCGGPIRSEVLAGRVLYWCPSCQTQH